MVISNIGFTKADLSTIYFILMAKADTYLDGNGAPPSRETQEYADYLSVFRLSQAFLMFFQQVTAFDTLNLTDTDPAALMTGQSGGF